MSRAVMLVIAGAIVMIVLIMLMTDGSEVDPRPVEQAANPAAQPSPAPAKGTPSTPSSAVPPKISQKSPPTSSGVALDRAELDRAELDRAELDRAERARGDSSQTSGTSRGATGTESEFTERQAPTVYRTLEELHGPGREISRELQELMENQPEPFYGDNWDEMLNNPPQLPPEIERILENPPAVTFSPEVEAIFRDRPPVPIPPETQRIIDQVVPIPPPPG